MCPQRFRKAPFSSVHTYARKQRFQKVPSWSAYSKSSVCIDCYHRIRVDGSRIRKDKVAFEMKTDACGQGLKIKACISVSARSLLSF